MNLFERSPERWKEVYLYGAKMPVNRGMAFGREMADGLEYGEATGDPVLDLIMEKLPKFEIMDKAIKTIFKTTKYNIPLLAKPDTMKKDMTAFKEYKTGQGRWNKGKVDEFGQITFYATVLFTITGKIPYEIELVHVLTKKIDKDSSDSKLEATGDVYRYPTQRSMGQVLNMIVRMKKAWESIQKITEAELL